MAYDFKKIEPKWQAYWEENSVFAADDTRKGDGFYILDMFPYPSGEGLHLGHPVGYIASDIWARYKRMNQVNVLHPMGWDAFGLPAENYAIKMGVHPAESTAKNIENFRRQIKSLGFSYDWDREINTSDPSYYKWTQWLFLELFNAGLAYQKEAPVNWCNNCQTGLANEQVVDGRCERCDELVVQKMLKQWFFKITDYADELLDGLEELDWPDRIKTMQTNWIGRSEGSMLTFKTEGGDKIDVFTTRPDTLMGATYMVLAPEHPLVEQVTSDKQAKKVAKYIETTLAKTELERSGAEGDRSGVWTGGYALHPITGEQVPIWIADYVLLSYGTGAVMAVPAHDERDWEFAKKHKLDVVEVVEGGDVKKEAYTGSGKLVNSGEFDGMDSEKAKAAITKAAKGKKTVQYRLRDWLISRQRYWGAPIPIIHCDTCGAVPVPTEDLPVELPEDVEFKPSGESPLAASEAFVNVKCPKCGADARREVDTMDTFVDSSWYFLRYTDPKNEEVFAGPAKIKKWCPVDLYIGGAEHAVMHLLYARFFTRALKDLGHVAFDEPFTALRNQGLILAEDGTKMSKSKGNVINPDDVVEQYGADTLRLYEMFMSPFEDEKPWSEKSIAGVHRFLYKVYALKDQVKDTKDSDEVLRTLNKTIAKVTDDIEAFKFNTAISSMMELVNALQKEKAISQDTWVRLLQILYPFAPHLCEELWSDVLGKDFYSLMQEKWPKATAKYLKEDTVNLVVQVNGKVRDTIEINMGATQDEAEGAALASENVQKFLDGKEANKIIYVPNKLINFVV